MGPLQAVTPGPLQAVALKWTYTAASRARGETQHLVLDDQTATRDDPEHELASLGPGRSATLSKLERDRGLAAMSRLEHALNCSDAERLASLQQTRGEELGQLTARLRDPRLGHPAGPSLDYSLDHHYRDHGRDLPDLGR